MSHQVTEPERTINKENDDIPDIDWEDDTFEEEAVLETVLPLAHTIESSRQASVNALMTAMASESASTVSAVQHTISNASAPFYHILLYTMSYLREIAEPEVAFTAQSLRDLERMWSAFYVIESHGSVNNSSALAVTPVPQQPHQRSTALTIIQEESPAIVEVTTVAVIPQKAAPSPPKKPASVRIIGKKRKTTDWLSACTDDDGDDGNKENIDPLTTIAAKYTPTWTASDAALADFEEYRLPEPTPTTTQVTKKPQSKPPTLKDAARVVRSQARVVLQSHRVETNPSLSPNVLSRTPNPSPSKNYIHVHKLVGTKPLSNMFTAYDCFAILEGREFFIRKLTIIHSPVWMMGSPSSTAGAMMVLPASSTSLFNASAIGRALSNALDKMPSLKPQQKAAAHPLFMRSVRDVVSERAVALPEATIIGNLDHCRYSAISDSSIGLGSCFGLFTPTAPDQPHTQSQSILRLTSAVHISRPTAV